MNTGPIIALSLIFAVLVFALVRVLLGYRRVRLDAGREWAFFYQHEPHNAVKTTQTIFVVKYCNAHNPRGWAYGIGTIVCAVLLTPLAVIFLGFFYMHVIAQPEVLDTAAAQTLADEIRNQFRLDGPLVYSFIIFFGLIISWVSVAYGFAFLYHRKSDMHLRQYRLVRGDGPLAAAKPARRRPKWSPLTKSEDGLILEPESNSPKD